MPLQQLCAVADVRNRLGQPSDPIQDAVIGAVMAAVEEKILDVTGYDWTGGVMSEQQTDVQLGVSRLMQKRPLLPMSSDPLKTVRLRARSLASSTFSDIIGDIRDAKKGRIMPLASELTPIFPPIGGLAPWSRWRQMIWPVVVFTYQVDPLGSTTNPVPDTLVSACIEWSAYIYATPAGGALRSVSIEGVSETYSAASQAALSMPVSVSMMLGAHLRDRASLIF